jgi:pilus assembly protein Flp/PilA
MKWVPFAHFKVTIQSSRPDRESKAGFRALEERHMKHYRAILNNLLKDESGQDLIEYALVAALIGLAAVAAMGGVAGGIKNAFNDVNTQLTTAIS